MEILGGIVFIGAAVLFVGFILLILWGAGRNANRINKVAKMIDDEYEKREKKP